MHACRVCRHNSCDVGYVATFTQYSVIEFLVSDRWCVQIVGDIRIADQLSTRFGGRRMLQGAVFSVARSCLGHGCSQRDAMRCDAIMRHSAYLQLLGKE